jgi:hypothetical protein
VPDHPLGELLASIVCSAEIRRRSSRLREKNDQRARGSPAQGTSAAPDRAPSCVSPAPFSGDAQRSSLVIFAPSMDRSPIKPFWPKTKAMTGSLAMTVLMLAALP